MTSEPILPASLIERCRRAGLSLTAPRRAILGALLDDPAPLDAVHVYQRSRQLHAPTSLGTVYRFLRELERERLCHVVATPHGRLRWRLSNDTDKAEDGSLTLLRQWADHLGYQLRQRRQRRPH